MSSYLFKFRLLFKMFLCSVVNNKNNQSKSALLISDVLLNGHHLFNLFFVISFHFIRGVYTFAWVFCALSVYWLGGE